MPVIFFDGVCGLCNSFVDWVMRHDPLKQFRFSPLQSDYAHQNLPAELLLDSSGSESIVFKMDGKTHTHSRAVLEVFKLLGYPWKVLFIFVLVPSVIRDAVYNFVAQNRYQWFGKKDQCRLPSPEEKERFLL